jgi:hypothetical protein
MTGSLLKTLKVVSVVATACRAAERHVTLVRSTKTSKGCQKLSFEYLQVSIRLMGHAMAMPFIVTRALCSLQPSFSLLEAFEQLLQLRICILRVLDFVSNRPLIAVDLPVVPTGVCLVAIEMDLVVDGATPCLLIRNVLEAVRLVPARGEHVKRDLAADRVCEAEVGERLLELCDHGWADVVLDIVGLVVVALLDRGVTADGGDVDHAVAELDEGAALNRDLEVGDVVKDPV